MKLGGMERDTSWFPNVDTYTGMRYFKVLRSGKWDYQGSFPDIEPGDCLWADGAGRGRFIAQFVLGSRPVFQWTRSRYGASWKLVSITQEG